MLAAIPFPNLSPEIFSITVFGVELALRWYALAYIVGILIGWRLAVVVAKRPGLWSGDPPITPAQLEDFVTWVIIGVIVGGRLGFVLFYQPAYYLANPLEIPAIWQGGMAFHGGFLGVVIAGIWWCRRNGVAMLQMADILALATPPALLLGRLANFINAELWGRATDVPWAVIFPGALAQDCAGPVGLINGLCARHPSQLYEAALEGLLLGLLLIYLVWRRGLLRLPGAALGIFVAGYGIGRFVVEFVRQPDLQFVTPDNPIGHAFPFGGGYGLTMGQALSIPMILVGLWFLTRALRAR